jgi:hypothetical protein
MDPSRRRDQRLVHTFQYVDDAVLGFQPVHDGPATDRLA